MKNLLKQYIGSTLFLITVLFFGCDNRLDDLEPQQGLSFDIAFSTAENVQNILVGNYANASQPASGGGGLNLASELLANSGELIWQGTFFEPREFNNKSISTTNSIVALAWLNGFSVSNQSNMILANKDKFKEAGEQDRVEG